MNAADNRDILVTIIHDKRPPKGSQAEKEWKECMNRLDEMKLGRMCNVKTIEASLDARYLNLVAADESKAIFFSREKISLRVSEPRYSENFDVVKLLIEAYFEKYRDEARLRSRV